MLLCQVKWLSMMAGELTLYLRHQKATGEIRESRFDITLAFNNKTLHKEPCWFFQENVQPLKQLAMEIKEEMKKKRRKKTPRMQTAET